MVVGGLLLAIAGCPAIVPPADSCAGVTCEGGQTCVDGACVAADPCADVICDEGLICENGNCVATEPAGLTGADLKRGGALYDKWWDVLGVEAPTADHTLWAQQTSNTRTGADTWRCKECHGWDYKGAAGAYGEGSSHFTGFAGIFGTTKTANELFDLLHNNHEYGDGGADIGDEAIWDLVKFVLDGQIDTDAIIDSDGSFNGDEVNGKTLYENGMGSNLACMICHGADGQQINFKEGTDEEEFVRDVAVDNPWEFQHKVRFGQPGEGMPASVDVDATNDDVADVGAYSQTLP